MTTTSKHYLVQTYELLNTNRKTFSSYRWNVLENHELKTLLNQLPQQFSFHGTVTDFPAVPLYIERDGKSSQEQCGTLGDPSVQTLISQSKGSSFGKGPDTVFDETVRKGKELTADHLSFGTIQVNRMTKTLDDLIREQIISKLPPDFLGDDVTVQFYKLAIYEAGGHFQTHRDTVHAANHRATLLIEVKSDHEGGELILEKNGSTVVWKLSGDDKEESDDDSELGKDGEELLFAAEVSGLKAAAIQRPDENANANSSVGKRVPESLNWCIFYTDITHRVEPITSGIRMVLQYDVYSRSASDFTREDEEDKEDEEEGKEDDDEKEDEEQDEEEDVIDPEDFDSEQDIFNTAHPIKTSPDTVLFAPKTNILASILNCLTAKLTPSTQAYAIPFYYLYTSQLITPESLKNLDRALFNALVKEGGFTVALVPVELVALSNPEDGYRSHELKLHDFPLRFYEFDSSQDTLKVKIIKKWPDSLNLTYIASGMEATSFLHSTVLEIIHK